MGPAGSLIYCSACARVIISTVVHVFLLCAVLASGNASGYSPKSSITTKWETQFPVQSAESKLGYGFKIIDANAVKYKYEYESTFRSGRSRSKRATDGIVDPKNLTTVANLTDSHTTLMVHWAGEGSDVIMALAKSSGDNSSAFFLSRDYGRTFTDVSSQLMADWSTKAVISNYYSVRSFNNYYVFTDEINKCVFTTDNNGENFVRHCGLPFSPRVVKLNQVNSRHILAMDDQSQLKQLYLSEDFGETWRSVYSQVKSFYWGIPPYDSASTIFVVEELPASNGQASGKLQVVRSDSLFHFSYNTVVILTDVTDFGIRDDYMHAIKSVNLLGSSYNPHLQLWVSYKRGEFMNAAFPGNHVFTDFYVADASEGQLMVCAYINSSYTNLYVSEVTGYKFSLSLERIVYFNPKTIPNQHWIRLYANETFADITKLHGVSGIYIASQQIGKTLEVEEQQSMITYDKGATWEMIQAPEYTIGNRPSNCKRVNNCSLHLTQEFHRLYPGSQTYPILTQHSSPGLVIASGVMGSTLKGDPDVFVSANAGVSWRQVLPGNYFYASADHGGIIVAAHQFIPSDEVVYSIDEGETWHSYRIVQAPIRVYGLLTEPGENTTVFSIFGSPLGRHRWQIIQLDLKDVFEGHKCGPSDYKMWSVGEDLPNSDGCFLGHVTLYQRRIARAVCYNGDDFVRRFEVSNCSCKREDFECDFGFQDNHGICQRDTSVRDADVYLIPSHCPAGSFYSYTRGYRKIAGDTCVGGEEHRFGPLQYSCPIQERAEFLLITLEDQVKMIDLANGAQVVLLDELVAYVPAVFDYELNCLIYVDVAGDMKRTCFATGNVSSIVNREIIHRKKSGISVNSMAFDWTGRNIFYTDSNNTIRVVNVDGRFERTLYGVNHGVHSPQAIIVDPHHGYLFFVGRDSPSQNFAIFRAAMDGSSSSVEVLIRGNVSQDTSLTLDLDTESLYWVTPSTGSGYLSDIEGRSVNFLFQHPASFQNPSGIGIYKNELYVSTRTGFGILVANKHTPTVWRYFAFTPAVYSMVVVSYTSQHAASACSAYNTPCSQLCLPRPGGDNHNRTCLCGEGYNSKVQPPSRDESCSCDNGVTLLKNGTCVKSTNSSSCAADRLTCHNGNCVRMTWKCDGEDDCGDGTDEIDCPYTTCGSTSFTCRTGKCIPNHWMCDQQDDCNDGFQSDELHCVNQTCKNDQFQCASGFCINKLWVCDMDNDCHDGSDEKNCSSHNSTCPPWSFACDSGTCIDGVYKCNGRNDCGDNSDEKQCSNHTSCVSDWQFDCGHEEGCIFAFWRCDGDVDCKNGADEIGCVLNTTIAPLTTHGPWICPFYSYKCTNNDCIGWEDVCNGINDCGDLSDETDCGSHLSTITTPPPSPVSTALPHWCNYNEFFCHADRHCLPMTRRCNGHVDCRDGTDEENCGFTCSAEQYRCAQGKCIWRAWVCDGAPDCPLEDDEMLCDNHTQKCVPSDFQCVEDGDCIPMSLRCNKVVDCQDGSDESECDYHGGVDCSNFDYSREACCSSPQCGVFISSWSGSSKCKNRTESLSLSARNYCEDPVSDAYTCKAGQFKCSDSSRSCISFVQVCDHKEDCRNGRDEIACGDCVALSSMEGTTYVVTNTSVTWGMSFEFTSLSYAEIIPGQSLANLTWRNMSLSVKDGKSVTVKELKPHTSYYFAFFKMSQGVACVLKSYNIVTADGIPSPPRNLTSRVHIENYPVTYAVDLQWTKPALPNGDIIFYIIYYQKKNASGKLSDVLVQRRRITDFERATVQVFIHKVADIQQNMTYEFWVTATTVGGESAPSQKSSISVIPAPDADLKVTVTDLADTSFRLTWTKAANAVGYQVNVLFPIVAEFPAATINEMVLHVNSSQTSVVVSGLCPGTTVSVRLQVVYANNLLGPEIWPYNTTTESGAVHLKGTTPVAVFTKVDLVDPTRILLRYNLTRGGPSVKQYYIYYTYDENTAPVNHSAVQMSHELYGLFACQKYFVWIRPAFPTCPFTDLKNISTEEDVKAPPKNVDVSVTRIEQHYSMNVTWKPFCSENLGIPEGYIIHLKIGDKEEHEVQSSSQNLSFPYVLDGTNYTVTVRSNHPGSQESASYTAFIPYVGKPYNIMHLPSQGSNITFVWQFPPALDPANKFKQFLVHTKSEGVEMTNNTTQHGISLFLPKYGKYVVTVTAQAESGHIIGEPGDYEFPFESDVSSPNTDAISISKTNLVAILVPSALVIVALSAGLVFFMVRHKRLQRSFLAFANSHYNIQSGTTTFSEEMGLDGDEPLIQGFSDDEPLVIA